MSLSRFVPSFCLLALAGVAACGPSKASKAVHVPGEDATIEDYEEMLKRAEAALGDVGIKASGPAASKQAARGEGASEADAAAPAAEESQSIDASGFNGDCDTLCDLSSTTCDLEVRICVMAARNGDDQRFEAACDRAGNDCELAEGVADQSCDCDY